MSKDVTELRERAEDGKLTEEDLAYLQQREGITRYASIQEAADEVVFEDSADEPEDEDNYSEMTVDELEDELEARDLPKTGNKAELIARLRESDQE